MKRHYLVALAVIVGCLFLAGGAVAEDDSLQGKQGEMPPMGPPDELQEVAHLIGTWDCAMMMKMDLASDSMTEFEGTATCSYILDGAAIQEINEGPEFGGMKFRGLSIVTYDREKRVWQMTWTDNMTARTSIYEGTRKNGVMTLVGEDRSAGQVYLSRITSYNETPTGYDWKMETSADTGKTWTTAATARYTKR